MISFLFDHFSDLRHAISHNKQHLPNSISVTNLSVPSPVFLQTRLHNLDINKLTWNVFWYSQVFHGLYNLRWCAHSTHSQTLCSEPASQRFWMTATNAHARLRDSRSAKDKKSKSFGSYVIQMLLKIPKFLQLMSIYVVFLTDSSILTDFWNSSKNDCFILSLISMSLNWIKSHGWENPTDGAWWAALRILAKMFPAFSYWEIWFEHLYEKRSLYTQHLFHTVQRSSEKCQHVLINLSNNQRDLYC